jgi:hypothetical protein
VETITSTVILPANGLTKAESQPSNVTRKRFARRKRLLAACGAVVIAGAIAAGFIITSAMHTSSMGSSVSASGPAPVVRAFFTAINQHDWQRVWSLGGKYLNRRPPYNTLSGMISGYRCTVNDEIERLSVSGQTASGRFTAHEAHGGIRTEQTYTFKYFISNGVIKSGDQRLLAGQAPPGCTVSI